MHHIVVSSAPTLLLVVATAAIAIPGLIHRALVPIGYTVGTRIVQLNYCFSTCFSIALAAFAVREDLPPWMTLVASNILILTGLTCLVAAIGLLNQKPRTNVLLLLPVVGWIILLALGGIAWGRPIRSAIFSALLLFLIWLAVFEANRLFRNRKVRSARDLAVMLSIVSTLLVGRIYTTATGNEAIQWILDLLRKLALPGAMPA